MDGSRSRTSRVLIIGLAWLGVILFFSGQNAINNLMHDRPVEFARAFVFEALYWVPWILATPLLFLVARRWPVAGPRWSRGVACHLAFVLVFGLAQSIWYLGARRWAAEAMLGASPEVASRMAGPFSPLLPYMWLTAFYKYWLFLGVYYSFAYYRRYREREVAAVQLEAQLAEAKLHSLEMQLQPHFLFNSLHTVSMLTLEDPAAANKVLARLSSLLRETLEAEEALVTLDRELQFLEQYLAIEQARFSDRLVVDYRVADDARRLLVPRLLLLPLVENAVRHGVSASSDAGLVVIAAEVHADRLVLTIADDGPGFANGHHSGTGLGLRLTRERLARLYPDDHELTIEPVAPTGTRVTIELPANVPEGPGP